MTTGTNTSGATDERHERLMGEARVQGVRPLSYEELLGDPAEGDSEKEDVDEFTAERRERRESEPARRRG